MLEDTFLFNDSTSLSLSCILKILSCFEAKIFRGWLCESQSLDIFEDTPGSDMWRLNFEASIEIESV